MEPPYPDRRFSVLSPSGCWPPEFSAEKISRSYPKPAMDWPSYNRLPHIPVNKSMDSYKTNYPVNYVNYADRGPVENAIKAPVKKQTHQAIREALSKRGMTLPLDRNWEKGTVANTSVPSPSHHHDHSVKADPDSECHKKRPQMSYMQLIQMALNSVPEKRMNLQQIYSWIEEHFPFFKLYARKGWKNSVRHNLSLYDIFVREKPDPNDEWKFSYWCLRPENAPNGLPNSATKREAERAEKAQMDGKKVGRGSAFVSGMPGVSDYVVAVPPSMQQSGSRPLLPRSSSDTVAVIPLDYMYQLPASQTGNFVCAQATPVRNPNFPAPNYESAPTGPGQSDSGYISLNGSVLPVFPGQSFSGDYKIPDTIPQPRNIVREASKQLNPESPKKKKSRKSLPCSEKPKKTKKRTKSEPFDLNSKENVNVFAPLEVSEVTSPLRMLLQSPPQGNFTSTPFKDKPLSTLRVTPIKTAPKSQSTPKAALPWDCAFFSPGGKKDDVSILSNRSFNLSIPGLTPLKDKENPEAGNVSMNDSLGKLLSDLQYDENLLDCGVMPMDMDIAGSSFLHGINAPSLSPRVSPKAGPSSRNMQL